MNLACPDSNLRQNRKHNFSDHLIDVNKPCESTHLNETHCIIDTMSVMRAVKVKEAYKECFKTVTKLTLPSKSLKP